MARQSDPKSRRGTDERGERVLMFGPRDFPFQQKEWAAVLYHRSALVLPIPCVAHPENARTFGAYIGDSEVAKACANLTTLVLETVHDARERDPGDPASEHRNAAKPKKKRRRGNAVVEEEESEEVVSIFDCRF